MAAVFANGEPLSKLEMAIKSYSLTFKGKPVSAANVSAVRGLQPFIFDSACSSAFEQAEMYFPELRDPTLLMRVGTACSAKAVSDAAKARDNFAFIMHSLRVARLTGDIPQDEKLSVSRVVGRDKKTPAMIQALFKKKELVEFIFQEARLIDQTMHDNMAAFQTPLSIVQHFAASGANGLVVPHRMTEWSRRVSWCWGPMDMLFSLKVAEHRQGADGKTKAMIDLVWPVWAGAYDEEIAELTLQEVQNNSAGFLWHTWLNETNRQVGVNYRVFVSECTGGPISCSPDTDQNLGLLGISELGDEQKEELHKLQEQLKLLRRKTVKFTSLPAVGAASGAEYSSSQLLAAWEQLSLGHRFSRKRGDVRCFVASAELFPPNIAMQGDKVKFSDTLKSDEAKLQHLIEFFISKRSREDILILFDGRSRANRRCIENLEEKMATGGTHELVEVWLVYLQPSKKQDARSAAAEASSYSINCRERVHCNRFASPASPNKGMSRCHRRGQWPPSSPLPPSLLGAPGRGRDSRRYHRHQRRPITGGLVIFWAVLYSVFGRSCFFSVVPFSFFLVLLSCFSAAPFTFSCGPV